MTPYPSPEKNEDHDICSACGGQCCRTRPGIEGPERFLTAPDPAGLLSDLLSSGLWVLDTHYGIPYDPEKGEKGDPDRIILYPRPATREERSEGRVLALPGAGECVYLRNNGCLLQFDDRPLACRALEPTAGFQCSSSWTRFDAARAWSPHQDVVSTALRRLGIDPPHH